MKIQKIAICDNNEGGRCKAAATRREIKMKIKIPLRFADSELNYISLVMVSNFDMFRNIIIFWGKR